MDSSELRISLIILHKKTDDEVWFAYYSKDLSGNINDTQEQWSFVYEDGQLKYGTIVRNKQ